MEIPSTSQDDVLAVPIRARLFDALGALRRPATTQELAALVERHPNSVRIHLQSLADAGLLERRVTRQARGRPRDHWAIAQDARPAGRAPEAYIQLSRWLARAAGAAGDFAGIERAGRDIGRELAPELGSPAADVAMQDALTALGFAPRPERPAPDRLGFVLANCPYRDAVRQNQPAVCTLHKGITAGLLDRLAPKARLADFVAKDPHVAGCLIEVEGVLPAGGGAPPPREPRHVPVPLPEQRHGRREEHRAHDRGVEKNRHCEADAHLLEDRRAQRPEDREDRDHHDGGARDDPGRRADAPA